MRSAIAAVLGASRLYLGPSVRRHFQLRKARYEHGPTQPAAGAPPPAAPISRVADGSGPRASSDKPRIPAVLQTIQRAWRPTAWNRLARQALDGTRVFPRAGIFS